MARADYVDVGGQETVLEFSGTFRHSREPVHGTGLILDMRSGGFVVFCDGPAFAEATAGGHILTVGDEAEVLATSFVVEYTGEPPVVAEWPIVHEPLDSVLARFPANVLISGELVADQPFEASVPIYAANNFQTVTVAGTSIRLVYASGADISGLGVRLPESSRKKQRELQAMREEVVAVGHELTAVANSLGKARDLLARHQLRNRLTELKSKEKSLKEKLKNNEMTAGLADSNEIAFSGKILMRKLPGWTRNQ